MYLRLTAQMSFFSTLPGFHRVSCPYISALLNVPSNGCPAHQFFGNTSFADAFVAFNMLVVFLNMVPLNYFFATLTISNLRHTQLCHTLRQLMRVDVSAELNIPILDMLVRTDITFRRCTLRLIIQMIATQTYSGNSASWARCFGIARHFGIRYKRRMDNFKSIV